MTVNQFVWSALLQSLSMATFTWNNFIAKVLSVANKNKKQGRGMGGTEFQSNKLDLICFVKIKSNKMTTFVL